MRLATFVFFARNATIQSCALPMPIYDVLVLFYCDPINQRGAVDLKSAQNTALIYISAPLTVDK